MFKQIVFFFISLFLFETVVYSQNIDTATYKQAANYVIGCYVRTYIGKKSKPELRDKFFKSEWIELEKNTFSKPISQERLEEIIDNLSNKISEYSNENIQKKTNEFYNAIKGKRDNYNKNKSNKDDVIKRLIQLPDKYFKDWKSRDGTPRFQQQCDDLREELFEKLPKNEVRNKKENSPDINIVSSEDTRRRTSIHKKDYYFNWFWIAVATIGLVFILKFKWFKKHFMIYFLKKENTTQTSGIIDNATKHKEVENNKIILRPKDFERIFNWMLSDPKRFVQFSEYVLLNEKICSLWVNGILKYPKISELLQKELLVREQPEIIDKKRIENKVTNDKPEIQSSSLYADAIIDGYFNKLTEKPNDDSVFELHLQDTHTATFTIHIAAYKRIIANPSFLEGCEKQVLSNAQNVNIERNGIAYKEANGRWRIIKTLGVILN